MHRNLRNIHFDLIALVYDALLGVPPVDRWQELLALPCKEPLLDLGGGTGRVSFPLLPYVKEVVVADLSSVMLDRAKIKGGLMAVRCRADSLPFPEAVFGRIIVVDALHHFVPANDAIKEIFRVLKPGGILVIEEPDFEHPLIRFVALAERLLLMKSRFYSPGALSQLLRAAGLTVRIIRKDRLRLWFVAVKQPPFLTPQDDNDHR